MKVLEATQKSTAQKTKRGYKAFHWRLLSFNVFLHGRELIWRLHPKDECQWQEEGTFKGPLEVSCQHSPLLSQSEIMIPDYDGRNHGGREFFFCCVACEERTSLYKVAFLGPILCFLNSVFKIIFMWRNLSCSLIASGWFLNIEFLLTPALNVLHQIKKQHGVGGAASLHFKWLQRVADTVAGNCVIGARSCHTELWHLGRSGSTLCGMELTPARKLSFLLIFALTCSAAAAKLQWPHRTGGQFLCGFVNFTAQSPT